MFLFSSVEAAWMPSEEAVEMAKDMGRAIDTHLPRKAAAGYMGISEGLLSEQLAGRKHISLVRCASLPVEVWGEFLKLRGRRIGYTVVEGDLGRLIKAVEEHFTGTIGKEKE